MSNQK